ncbi:TetR/AcrR family transcriptional regulator [Saccharopolyspora erythraea]|uniref:TetR/AcrR family transcriptional regulator n=1 Tax=Saccharopolyspora erythraea TaxID=1836 RepID=UPI001BA5C51D|nr:TetR/AcrR family transcriptional regulator [Saccharopolyspora erythraea]QUH04597.1 TetR/AcrR family transcriptional regulator [Saccharopolyspora erythraea]
MTSTPTPGSPGTTPAAGTRKARAAETEAALKAAAKRVFARAGYLNARITDITAEAGRSAGSFYNHFADKEALLESLLADVLAETDRAVAADPGHDQDFSRRQSIRWHVARFWEFARAHRVELVALRQAALVDARFADRLTALLEPDLRHLAQHLRGIGGLPAEPEAVALAISGLWWQFASARLVDEAPLARSISDEAAVDLLTELTHRGINGGAA